MTVSIRSNSNVAGPIFAQQISFLQAHYYAFLSTAPPHPSSSYHLPRQHPFQMRQQLMCFHPFFWYCILFLNIYHGDSTFLLVQSSYWLYQSVSEYAGLVIFLVEGMIVGNGGHALPQSWSRLGPGMHQHKTNLSKPTFVGLPKAFGLDMSNAKSSSSSSSSNCCWLQYFLDTSINYHSSNASEVGALANK
jgi:hypothetical protein